MNRIKYFQYYLYNNSFNVNKRFCSTNIYDVYSKNITNTNAVIKGWVRAFREMKHMIFFDINDGSSFKNLQIAVNRNSSPTNLGYGCSVEVYGKLTKSPSGKIELLAEEIKVIGECNLSDYPLNKKIDRLSNAENIREHLSLRPRLDSFSTLLKVRANIFHNIHKYFDDNQFVFIHTPILTSNDCEGAGEIFKVMPNNEQIIEEMKLQDMHQQAIEQQPDEVFFKNKTYMTVSGQLHLECMARSLNKVYCFGPTFRAENSKSRFHLAEFYMVEAEIAFINHLTDLLPIVESLIKTVVTNMLNNYEEILHYKKILGISDRIDITQNIVKNNFEIITYHEAFEILKRHSDKFTHSPVLNKSLTKEQEFFLVQYAGNIPIFVINFPAGIKPFYMKKLNYDSNDENSKAACFDLLVPNVGELCGGSIREDNYAYLKDSLEQSNLLDKLNWYLQLRKYGNVCTAGFGMGFERLLQVLLGTPNIKDTIPIPRWPHNCKH